MRMIRLAALAHPRIKTAPEKLREALRGRIAPHLRLLLHSHLQQIDALDVAIGFLDREADARIEPFRTAVELMLAIPGIFDLSARIIAAEIDTDMSRFATVSRLISGLCPKNDERAGRRQSTTIGKECALAQDHIGAMCLVPRARRTAIATPNSTAFAPAAASKRPSARSLLRCSPPSIICVAMEPATMISVTTTLIGAPNPSTPTVLSQGCKTSTVPFRSPLDGIIATSSPKHACGTVRKFVARSEQVGFLLVSHRPAADPP